MRRIMLVVTMALVMAAMMVAMAAPAFAGGTCRDTNFGDNCVFAVGSPDVNVQMHQLTNFQSGLHLFGHKHNVHGSGEPFVVNCHVKEGEDLACHGPK